MKELEQPLISIIVPVYKVEKYLKRCVDSILTQTYQNMEVILVDDGSPDNCGAICDRYKETDNRVVVIHKKNGGLSDARNAAIPLAKGEYISFIDSDDWVSSYYVEHLYEAVAKCDADIGISWFENVFEEKGFVKIFNDFFSGNKKCGNTGVDWRLDPLADFNSYMTSTYKPCKSSLDFFNQKITEVTSNKTEVCNNMNG